MIIPSPSLDVIMNTSLDAVVAMDEQGIIVGWNHNAELTFGYTALEALNQYMVELIIPPDFRLAHKQGVTRFLTTGEVRIMGKRITVPALHKDGHQISIEIAIMITSSVDNRCFIGFIRDLTAEIAAKNKIENLQNELLHFNRLNAMGTAAAMIAHELNQPLAAAKNYLSGFQLLAQSSDLQDKSLGFAIDHAQEAMRTAAEILKAVRGIVGQQPVESSPFKLQALMVNAIRLIDSSLPCVPIFKLGRSAETVLVNRGEIEQVLLNLIRNAAEAVREHPDPMIICSSKRVGDMIEVCVWDNGVGIPIDALDDLFAAFKSTKEDGLGLGLALCRAIVEQRGGNIWVQSDQSGTAVTFTVAAA